MKKRVCSVFLILSLLLTVLPAGVFAASREEESIDFATFLKKVEAAGYNYDGEGVTVKWSPSSACTDNRSNHSCRFLDGPENHQPNGNNAQRIQKPNAQYQIFSGQGNIAISNVHFVFEPADFTLCMNNTGWSGEATAEEIPNAELQLQNNGDVTFTNCSFDQVIVGAYLQGGKTTAGSTTKFDACTFENIYNAYSIKDVYSTNLIVTGCEFETCGGGIYLEGTLEKGSITITGNKFTDVDTYAADDKIGTRGLIQFSASGDYSSAQISITGNTSTGDAAVLRQLNYTVDMDAVEKIISDGSNSFAGKPFTSNSIGDMEQLPPETSFPDDRTVYDGTDYYKTMKEALEGIHKNAERRTLWCKPGADVGVMTHGHVCADLTVYGNGAYISGGERDFEVDTYKYCHVTSDTCNGLTGDLTLTVYNLNGAAAWGERTSKHTVNIVMQGCENMNRVYISGTAGKNNITVTDCTFDATPSDYKKANSCSIYSNAPGTILVEDCEFTGVMAPVNLNNKAAAGTEQEITVRNCTFTDCSTKEICDKKQILYAAPIRIVSSEGAVSTATIDGCTFNYNGGQQSANGDILLGDGREDGTSYPVSASIVNTDALVQIQNPGDRTVDGNTGKTMQIEASEESVNVSNAVAQIDKQGYTSLGDAITAASSMTGNVTIELLADADISDPAVRSFDLSSSQLSGLTICGLNKNVKLISGVDGNDIDGPYCPVLSVKLPENVSLTVENLTFPNDLLFDSPDGTVAVQNCVFNGAQSGYPKANKISYLNNTFEFKGTADKFYSHNAYPVWYKLENEKDFVFTGNTVIGYRGVHIETRGQADLTVNNNHFTLEDSDHGNKCVALQLVGKVNGDVSFCDNYVDAHIAVCLYDGIRYDDGRMKVENNYLVSGCKLFGSNEWSSSWTDEEAADAFAEAFMEKVLEEGGSVSESHTKHDYVGGTCTICGRKRPSTSGSNTPQLPVALPTAPELTPEPTDPSTPSGFVSDTTNDLTVDGVYQFRITSLDGTVPFLTVSNANFRVEFVSQEGSDYFFKIYAQGAAGSTTEISVNGTALLTATVGGSAQVDGVISDTTAPFTVVKGGTYQFRLTASERPSFAAGSASFTVEYAGQIGSDYFYKVHAVGEPGDGCGFYINGASTPVAVAHIA